jgi:hypothetical protein
MKTDTGPQLPARREFRSHKRHEFNAALALATRDESMLLTIETDSAGETVAILHRGPLSPMVLPS